jgi:hypothetical protein
MSNYGEGGYGTETYGGVEGGGGISGTRVQQWTPFTMGGQAYSAGDGLVLDGGVLSLEEVLTIPHGGTGGTYVGEATANLGIVTYYVSDLPALTAGVPCVLFHGLGTTEIGVKFRTTDDDEEISLDWSVVDEATMVVYSGADFADSAIRIEAVA